MPAFAEPSFASDAHRLRLHSRPELIGGAVDELVDRAIDAGAVPRKSAYRVKLALHEALTNAVVHGNLELQSSLKEEGDDTFFRAMEERLADPRLAGRMVTVEADSDGNTYRWSITDQGPGFDLNSVDSILKPDPSEEVRPCGRGLALIQACVDEMHFEMGGCRVILGVRFP